MKKIKKIDFPSKMFPQKLSLCSSITSIPDIYKVRNLLEKYFPDEPAFGTFFAEGNKNKDGVISWQITNDTKTGDLYLLKEFNQDEREKLENVCGELENKIRVWIEKNRNASQFREDVQLFENLLIYPQTNSLFAGSFDRAGDKTYFPVRVGWACQLASEKAGQRGSLTTDADPKNTIDEGQKDEAAIETSQTKNDITSSNEIGAVTKSTDKSFPYYVLWLLNFLLIIIIGSLLVPACNLKLIGTCDTQQASFSTLATKVSQLELQLIKEMKFCNYEVLGGKEVSAIEDVGQELPKTNLTEVDKRLNDSDANFGMLNFTLVWNTRDDLDIFVTCPNGGKIGYNSKTQLQNGCGSLDVDRNSSMNGIVLDPIEHIIVDDASVGDEFILEVSMHKRNEPTASKVDFSLIVKSDRVLKRFDGQVMNKDDNWKVEYRYATD